MWTFVILDARRRERRLILDLGFSFGQRRLSLLHGLAPTFLPVTEPSKTGRKVQRRCFHAPAGRHHRPLHDRSSDSSSSWFFPVLRHISGAPRTDHGQCNKEENALVFLYVSRFGLLRIINSGPAKRDMPPEIEVDGPLDIAQIGVYP
jgi:hypothetical protein